jgi:demethylmenaquinone methyltransferase/2-methoxy-6-polyprenyl-1,4-benzoquinol methylase
VSQSFKERRVKTYFRKIAPQYDLVNTLVSFGFHHHWRKFTVKKADLRPGQQVLDICCGTGLITKDLAEKVSPDGNVVGLDLSPSMLAVADQNLADSPWRHRIRLVEGNALSLPFADNSFDRAVIGYGLRNVSDMRQALRELFRVLKPEGKAIALELATPPYPVFKQLHYLYTSLILPLVGSFLTGNKDPYLYLYRSVQVYPDPQQVAAVFREFGFTQVHFDQLCWGIATVHIGTKPALFPPQ